MGDSGQRHRGDETFIGDRLPETGRSLAPVDWRGGIVSLVQQWSATNFAHFDAGPEVETIKRDQQRVLTHRGASSGNLYRTTAPAEIRRVAIDGCRHRDLARFVNREPMHRNRDQFAVSSSPPALSSHAARV